MDPSTILLIIIVVLTGLVIILYNRMVALRQTRYNAFSDIDVQLKQRYNLVPQLVETVKGYAKHERETLQKVTDARAQVNQAEGGAGEKRMKAEGLLGGAMGLFGCRGELSRP